jgi:Mn2+/Fe2+ NRAMP family transporter
MKTNSLLKGLGPGIILAGAAIGVSHLVQATRAGADYGFSLLWLLLLACLTKYPFLQIGPRYANATGKNLVEGYLSIGKWAYWLFIMITVGTMFIILSAVTLVTAGIAEMLFQFGWSIQLWSACILGFCVVLLLFGRYTALDFSMKLIITILTICTLTAVVLAAWNFDYSNGIPINADYLNIAGITFIIAMMGWMPIPLDAAVWHSIWTIEKSKKEGKSNLRASIFDFNMGYFVATFIGVLFLSLGAFVMFGSSGFSSNSVQFSGQLIDMYQNVLGHWSAPLISIAAFITMISTTLAVTDAYPRVIVKIIESAKPVTLTKAKSTYWYNLSLFLIPIIPLYIIDSQRGAFTVLIDFATSLSFLAAPLLAWMNLRLLQQKDFPVDALPNKKFMVLAYLSLGFLILFCIMYLNIWLF